MFVFIDINTPIVMFVIVQPAASADLTPTTCKQLELTFLQFSQSHNAPAVPAGGDARYKSSSDIKMESGHRSGGSDFQRALAVSESWLATSKQQSDYVVSSSSNVAVNGAEAPGPAKMSNRPTGPRKPKPEVAVSMM